MHESSREITKIDKELINKYPDIEGFQIDDSYINNFYIKFIHFNESEVHLKIDIYNIDHDCGGSNFCRQSGYVGILEKNGFHESDDHPSYTTINSACHYEQFLTECGDHFGKFEILVNLKTFVMKSQRGLDSYKNYYGESRYENYSLNRETGILKITHNVDLIVNQKFGNDEKPDPHSGTYTSQPILVKVVNAPKNRIWRTDQLNFNYTQTKSTTRFRTAQDRA